MNLYPSTCYHTGVDIFDSLLFTLHRDSLPIQSSTNLLGFGNLQAEDVVEMSWAGAVPGCECIGVSCVVHIPTSPIFKPIENQELRFIKSYYSITRCFMSLSTRLYYWTTITNCGN